MHRLLSPKWQTIIFAHIVLGQNSTCLVTFSASFMVCVMKLEGQSNKFNQASLKTKLFSLFTVVLQ